MVSSSVLTPCDEGDARGRRIRIDASHCVGPVDRRFLFGGMGTALCIEALQTGLEAAVRAISIQFIRPVAVGAELVLNTPRTAGRSLVQASIEGRVADTLVLNGFASLGAGATQLNLPGRVAPTAPPPERCPVSRAHDRADEDVHARLEIRSARGRYGVFSKDPVSEDGHVLIWIRPLDGPLDARHLAMAADFLPSTTADAFAERAGGSSLDNTFRLVRMAPTDWVLCDLAIRGVSDGIAHGSVELWSRTGDLMALASQSFIPRLMPR